MKNLLHLHILARRVDRANRLGTGALATAFDETDFEIRTESGCSVENECYRSRTALAAIRLLSALLLSLTLTVATVTAKSLAEYHLQMREAITALDTMSQHDESESESDRSTRMQQTLTSVRAAMPETDQVEIGETKVEVNNAWLHRELDNYEKTQTDRAGTLTRILERLRALEQRVAELDQQGRTTSDKAAANKKLSDILSRPEYMHNAKTQSALERLLERIGKWLQQFIPKPRPIGQGGAGFISQIAQVLVILVALAVIAYVVKTFAPRVFRGRRVKKKSKAEPRIVLGETLAPEESAVDILASAEALARRGELRAAIRKAYIALLVELGDRKILSLAQYKTNRDYLRAMREVEPLHTNVKQLTDSFERHWYGFALATDADWTAFRARYKQALQELN